MSNRTKRKFDLDPTASDPEDDDYDDVDRAPPQRRRANRTPGTKKPGNKRQRRGYGGSDIDDDDEDVIEDDSFTERSESEEPEVNPATGRSVRRATKKQVTYEESDEDEIEDTASDSEDDKPRKAGRRRVAKQSIEEVDKPSLIVKLKMPENAFGRSLRTRTGSKSTAPTTRGRTPETGITRRSSRLSHDVEAPMVALSDSGKHANVVREGTRTPEPSTARATRGGKGPRVQAPSTIEEASQEVSMIRDDAEGEEDSPGPLDKLLVGAQMQVESSAPDPSEQDAQGTKDEDDDDDGMDGVIQESQHDRAADEDSDEEEGPITRGGRNLRSRATSQKRKRGADESSDFEPVDVDAEGEEEEMSESDNGKGKGTTSDSNSGSARKTRGRTRQSQRSRRNSSDEESALDDDELQDELQELSTHKRRRLSRRVPDNDLSYDAGPRRRERRTVDYRVVRPELNAVFENNEDDDGPAPSASKSRSKAGAGAVSLFSNQGPFGGGQVGFGQDDDSDSSDEDVQKMPRQFGSIVGMTPTAATAPGFGAFPQAHNNSAPEKGAGGGPANFGKIKDKKALADADPLGVDPNVNFDGVGGLDDHINKLKEMIMLPLLYPEVFQRFKITPPRGVLFHGPPGTGKTLLARALASSVSSHGQKVTFYMRKGADALSKWVGEAEKQLRTLFEEARKTQPSIIFFDEIDGLAPVRSSKQEQIHASIVATLLALMDGMDGRGQVVVIGATNRPDSVDNALRRPGRFDREFYFPLPNIIGRRAILDIHTKNWDPPLDPKMKDQLAELTKGYGGADLRALCTEAALNAVQGTYPQIYQSEKKLLIHPSEIKVLAKDFMVSVNKMVPSSQRTATAAANPLPKLIEPLLRKPLADIVKRINELIPRRKVLTALEEAEYDDREDEKGFERETTMRNFESSRIFRPRLLITGLQGMGQQYLGAALLSKIEGLHVQSFDLPTILEDSTRSPEAAITQLFTEVRRHKPSVIYIPAVDVWYNTLPPAATKTFKLLLRSIGANEPIMVLGVMELESQEDKPDRQMMVDLFGFSLHNQFELARPDHEGRSEFFSSISQYVRMSPADFPDLENRKKRVLPVLEPAPVVEPVLDPKEVAAREKAQRKQDALTLNKLKSLIQPIMDNLKKKHRRFFKPILEPSWWSYLLDEQNPNRITSDLDREQQEAEGMTRPWEASTDNKGVGVLLHIESGNKYYNLDLSQIEQRLSNGYYKRPKDFLFDIKTLAKDSKTFQDAERTLKANEMVANVEVDIDSWFTGTDAQYGWLTKECDALYERELHRVKKAQEKRKKAITDGEEVPPEVAPIPPEQSLTTTENTSGPIVLGEPIPRFPPVTPTRAPHDQSLSNGTSGEHSQQNGSTVPSRAAEEDSIMPDSQQDVTASTQADLHFQTPSRPNTQLTQKSQTSARTFVNPNMLPHDYYNSASTTTSGNQTSKRSSDNKFGTQSSNGVSHAGLPDLVAPAGGSQLPDTQGAPESFYRRFELDPPLSPQHSANSSFNSEQHFLSQRSGSPPSQTSQPSQASQMPAPAPPAHKSNIVDILAEPQPEPQVILEEASLMQLHSKLVSSSSGCSLEQLEQVNAALMDTIWAHRREYNRNKVISAVADTFNVIIEDIETMQKILQPSQEFAEQQPMQYALDASQRGPYTQDAGYYTEPARTQR
ncbi:TAT-binding protein-like protein 7, AAA ATPase [Didymella glomerata]|uniref:TAT-binding protein-like protein 7, AAA ATPase n=1 Tax=Didymella glomerata TaxID=749621 RepID=A0A9W8X921_9PLEO|nr:TAT-binding protein-like protein 7, AAA ATPase [Didymella glomerata]